MAIHANKTCFINVSLGKWYTIGQDRFKGSLLAHGFEGDILTWKDEWPSSEFSRECIYNCKADAFKMAIAKGYEVIIWGDASVYAVQNPNPFVEVVRNKGYWLGQSGHNAAQTCSDACLKYFGISRDEAEKINDCATGLFGVNIKQDLPREFIQRFIKAGKEGAFHGSRKHAGQSKDPRFKFARQDQSCATIIAAQLGMKLDVFAEFAGFRWDTYPSIFKLEGM